MNFQISRNGQIYGPYTLDDLKRYLASGNVLLTDLAKSETMTEWLPVSEVLANDGVPPVPPQSEQPATAYSSPANPAAAPYVPVPISAPASAAIAMSAYPDPPSLHWALVMLFTLLTCGLFIVIWNLIVSYWLRRVQPNANAFYFYVAHAVLLLFVFITPGHSSHWFMFGYHNGSGFFGGLLVLATWVVKLVARFSEMASLEEHFNGPEPIGLVLNPVMVFFFGGLYFQHHLTRIYAIKQAARFGRAAAPYAY